MNIPKRKPSNVVFNKYGSAAMETIQSGIQYFDSTFGVYQSSMPFYCCFVSTLEENKIRDKINSIMTACRAARVVPEDYNINRNILIGTGEPKTITVSCDWHAAKKTHALTQYVIKEFRGQNDFDHEQNKIIAYCKKDLFNDTMRATKEHVSTNKITSFEGEHSFLSNFHKAQVTLDNRTSNSENLYQSKKFLPNDRGTIKQTLSGIKINQTNNQTIETFDQFISYILGLEPNKAKTFARKFEKNILQKSIRFDRDRIKIDYMILITYLKFTQNENLKQQLLETNDSFLIEGGHDSFWGMHNGKRTNYLGRILMIVRSLLQKKLNHVLAFQALVKLPCHLVT